MMDVESDDPTRIRTLAVTTEDLVAALQARTQGDQPVVLRATPPFSGRMRARLHVGPAEYEGAPSPLHVDPAAMVEESAPAFPRPAETEDELRAEPDVTYTVERHHDRHQEAIDSWRTRMCEHVRERATIETSDGRHEVEISLLG